MIRTVLGVTITIAGCLLLGVLISHGLLFPHIIGPITLVAVGTVLLNIKRKGERNE